MDINIFSTKEQAISPVIGIMLMLVVTVIIAAVVSGFAGGLIQTEDKVPQASITGKYSQYNGFTMTHAGGDSLAIKDLYITVRPSDEFGRGQSEYGQIIVNLSTISDVKGKYWINPVDATYGVMSWRAGESMFVKGGADLQNSKLIKNTQDWPPCYNEAIQGGKPAPKYCFVTSLNNQINLGKTFTLEITRKDGRMISSSKVIVEP